MTMVISFPRRLDPQIGLRFSKLAVEFLRSAVFITGLALGEPSAKYLVLML